MLLFWSVQSLAQEPKKEEKADTVKKEKPKKKKDLPLEAARTIPIKTNEGTWMSLDVSPDGKTIVFDFLGDIFTMPISGGKPVAFTKGMAFDSNPRFSPDGTKISFISDRSGGENIWWFSVDNKDSLQVTKGNTDHYQSAEWTPDGNYLVGSRGTRNFKLWMFHREGGSGAQLINKPDNLKTVEPSFGSDGRYIWFSQRIGAWNYNAQLPQYQLAIYDRETGETEVETARYGSAFSPTLSPDGKWLVYGSRYNDQTGLLIRDLSSGDEKWLAYPVQRDEQESIAPLGVLPAMSFTPDSKNVVASYGGKFYSIPVTGGNAANIPFQMETDFQLGPLVDFKYPIKDDKEMIVTQIRDGVVSPNGKQLAFTALNRLYLMDLPSGTPKRITTNNFTEAQPAWSTDGSQLAWVTWEGTGGHIYKINYKAKAPKATRLTTTPALYSEPVWSQNNRIVFMRGTAFNFKEDEGPSTFASQKDIAWIGSEGGAVTLIDKSNRRSNPHFTKAGDRIYLYSGQKGLVSIRWDGTDEKEHLKITGITTYGSELGENVNHCMMVESATEPQKTPSNAALVLMAPEGDQALAKINNELYVVTVPVTGGEVPKISVAEADKAQFPARKLTKLGGEFPTWSSNAKTVYFSLGNAFFTYNIDSAKTKEDELKKKKQPKRKPKKRRLSKMKRKRMMKMVERKRMIRKRTKAINQAK